MWFLLEQGIQTDQDSSLPQPDYGNSFFKTENLSGTWAVVFLFGVLVSGVRASAKRHHQNCISTQLDSDLTNQRKDAYRHVWSDNLLTSRGTHRQQSFIPDNSVTGRQVDR